MAIRYLFICTLAVLSMCSSCTAGEGQQAPLSPERQLILAAFQLNLERVNKLIDSGANVNARFGKYDRLAFRDKRMLGYSPLGSDKWTPLQAVAHSHKAPDPDHETENTTEARDKAAAELKRIDPNVLRQRNERRLAISRRLIAAGANLDAHDGYGATALATAIYLGYNDLALLLVESNAAVNTKTGVYIDGAGDITPLHRAVRSPRIVKALLNKGADVAARATDGSTPLHWAVLDAEPESVRLLIKAGADVNARDGQGHSPLYWCHDGSLFDEPGDKDRRKIRQMLRDAGAN